MIKLRKLFHKVLYERVFVSANDMVMPEECQQVRYANRVEMLLWFQLPGLDSDATRFRIPFILFFHVSAFTCYVLKACFENPHDLSTSMCFSLLGKFKSLSLKTYNFQQLTAKETKISSKTAWNYFIVLFYMKEWKVMLYRCLVITAPLPYNPPESLRGQKYYSRALQIYTIIASEAVRSIGAKPYSIIAL